MKVPLKLSFFQSNYESPPKLIALNKKSRKNISPSPMDIDYLVSYTNKIIVLDLSFI